VKRWGIPLCAFGLILYFLYTLVAFPLSASARFQAEFLTAFLAVLLIGGIIYAMKGRPTKVIPPPDQPVEKVLEREVITERVMVVCPFCSTKVEQGVAFCPNCDGKM
jgi:hypothetical protein